MMNEVQRKREEAQRRRTEGVNASAKGWKKVVEGTGRSVQSGLESG